MLENEYLVALHKDPQEHEEPRAKRSKNTQTEKKETDSVRVENV